MTHQSQSITANLTRADKGTAPVKGYSCLGQVWFRSMNPEARTTGESAL